MNAVLDTNILVSGLLSSKGNPAQIINALKNRRFIVFYNDEIIDEYKDVLFRERLGLNAGDIGELLRGIYSFGIDIIPNKSSIIMPDEDDRIFYDTAKTADAYLVTGNGKHYPKEDFVVTPAEFNMLLNG